MLIYDLTCIIKEYGVLYGLLSLVGLGIIGGMLGYFLSRKCHEWAIPPDRRKLLHRQDPWHRRQEWTYESLGIWAFLMLSFYLDFVWFFSQGASIFNAFAEESGSEEAVKIVAGFGIVVGVLNAWSSSFLVEAQTDCWGSGKNLAISDGVSKFWWTFWIGVAYSFFYICHTIGVHKERTTVYLLYNGWIPAIGFVLFFLALFNTNRLLRTINTYKLYKEEEETGCICENSAVEDIYWNT